MTIVLIISDDPVGVCKQKFRIIMFPVRNSTSGLQKFGRCFLVKTQSDLTIIVLLFLQLRWVAYVWQLV